MSDRIIRCPCCGHNFKTSLGKIPPPSVQERFLKFVRVNEKTGCWEWLGCVGRDGYGQFKKNRINSIAHRVSYELFVDEIPEGLHIDHVCRNKKCVNPEHLEAVPQKINLSRRVNIGRKKRPHF